MNTELAAQAEQNGVFPDPDAFPDRDVVIYDGQCVFCRGSVRQLKRFDRIRPRLAFLSLHDPRVGERYAELSHNQLMDEMWVATKAGDRWGGADAVRYLTRCLPLLWVAAPLLHLPGTANLWRWLYRQVAKRRYRIAGRDCDSGTCRI